MWCLYDISYLQFKYVKAYSAVLLFIMTDRCNSLIYSIVSALGLQVRWIMIIKKQRWVCQILNRKTSNYREHSKHFAGGSGVPEAANDTNDILEILELVFSN